MCVFQFLLAPIVPYPIILVLVLHHIIIIIILLSIHSKLNEPQFFLFLSTIQIASEVVISKIT